MRSVRRAPAVHPVISYPVAVDGVEVTRTYQPVSPPRTPPRVRRQSINLSSPTTWLPRTPVSEKPAGPHPATKPVRISEPHFTNALDLVITPRHAPLGSGATVVRTARDALSPSVREEPKAPLQDDNMTNSAPSPSEDGSRALPPLPLSYSPRKQLNQSLSSRCASPVVTKPTRPIPDGPVSPDNTLVPASSSTSKVVAQLTPNHLPPVPPIPSNLISASHQPTLDPVLVAPLSGRVADPSKAIVTLETSTMSQRTTLSTLMGRPSHLSQWLSTMAKGRKSLAQALEDEDDASVYSESDETAFQSIFSDRSGANPTMHVFLDRPSAPYVHVLAYLRSPVQDKPVLPRSAQLTTSSSSRVDALVELRDEAVYLGLDELAKMCTEELATRYRPRLNLRGRRDSTTLHVRARSDDSVRSSSTIVAPSTFPEQTSYGGPTAPESTRTTPVITTEPKSRLSAHKSTQSLYDLYDHSPMALHFPGAVVAPIPTGTIPAIAPTTHSGLHKRVASRTRNESRDFTSTKIRPTALWI